MRGLPLWIVIGALLAGCAEAGSGSPEPNLLPGASEDQGASLTPTGSLAAGDTTLTPGCFLTPAEVEAATGRTLSGPPDVSIGPKGDVSCTFQLGGQVPAGGFGCNCLDTYGPFDLKGQGTGWFQTFPPGGQMITGVADGAYLVSGYTGNDLYAVSGQTGIHIGINFQFLTAEEFSTLANAAFAHLEAGA